MTHNQHLQNKENTLNLKKKKKKINDQINYYGHLFLDIALILGFQTPKRILFFLTTYWPCGIYFVGAYTEHVITVLLSC